MRSSSSVVVLIFGILAFMLGCQTVFAESRFQVTSMQGGAPDFKVKRVSAEGQPFARAWQAATLKRPATTWSFQLGATNKLAIAKGDQMLVTFYARNADPAAANDPETLAYTELIIEQGSDPWTKLLEYSVSAGPQWSRYAVPFKASETFAAGKTNINFRAGFEPQVIEIGGVELANYGAAGLPKDVSVTSVSYPGREADAPWRKAAADRIEQIRKGDLTVEVSDGAGRPVAGADVSVRMTRHSFGWGTAVDPEFLVEDETYRTKVVNLFNLAVIENHLKWPMLEWKGIQPALDGIALLNEHGISVRGHNLVWPGLEYLPESAKSLLGQPELLRSTIAQHVSQTASATKGKVVEWDVINEPIYNHVVQDILGRDVMVDWFKLARAADSGVRLTLNEAGALESPRRSDAVINQNIDNIRFLLDKGAPLDVIGLQAHYGWGMPAPSEVVSVLDRYAQFGKPICISEFDVNVTDEQLQADYTRDFLTAAFSSPAVESVLFWGFWAGRHWLPEGALYRQDWSLRPLGQVYKDLVFKAWWTDVKGATSSGGGYRTRGFLGDYEVTVKSGQKVKMVKATLPREGTTVKVVLK